MPCQYPELGALQASVPTQPMAAFVNLNLWREWPIWGRKPNGSLAQVPPNPPVRNRPRIIGIVETGRTTMPRDDSLRSKETP